jgi:RNA polymerase sigma-70 factor (ECF subfamily)
MDLKLTHDHDSDQLPGKSIKIGEQDFDVFFKENFIRLCAFCQYKFSLDLHQAKEVVHTAFIKLWETRHHILPGQSAKSYLYRIITNNCRDLLKHEKVKLAYQKAVFENASSLSVNEFQNVDVKEMAANIDKAVAELPDQMRRIFELSRYEGLKYGEIAGHLNISVKTVETQMSRALVKLREKLSHYLVSIFILVSVMVTIKCRMP